jgi:hypothetical protein
MDRAAAKGPVFEKDVLPLLQARCLQCHGADKQKADLDLRTRAAMLRGGEGGPVLQPGSAESSLIWVKVAADKMPPGKDKLTEAEKAVLRSWIESGAREDGTAVTAAPEPAVDRQVTEEDRRFWSFRTPVRPSIPQVRHPGRVRNAVDAFILAELEKKGLTLSPEADRQTLLRRVHFDLLGLPPSPQEMEAFLADRSADAYERLIDRLLASSHHGERWARHWLDVAGYADSEGILDADYVRTAAWRYRDYVIRAFNQDKPYDRFLQEQIAGDELTDYWTAYRTRPELGPEIVEGLIATGFLRCASDTSRPDFVNIKNAPGYYYQTLDDTVRILSSATMGLSLHCAKCHSHKYDPIPQTDYYRVQAIFMSGYRPTQWVPQVQRRLLEATEVQEKTASTHNARLDAAINQVKVQQDLLRFQYAYRLYADRLARLPDTLRDEVAAALAAEAARRSEAQKALVVKYEKELRPDKAALLKVLPETYPDYQRKFQELETTIRTEEARRIPLPEIRALYDLPGEAKTHLLRRGDYRNPGPEVQPGVLSVLSAPQPFAWTPPGKDARTSGRRSAFAAWLTQPAHPLTARVLVNRLWLHHFGQGLVATPDNFGRAGAAPSHPELLDWLATEFVARGWSIKAMHRLILTSSTYRQSATPPVSPPSQGGEKEGVAAASKVDPENRLLWRQRLRRLEAEALRDAVLAVAGNLNPEMFGPPVLMQRQRDGEVTTPADASGNRRSIYLQVRRSQPLTLLQVFDQPVMETNCTHRPVSTVSSQALTLLNSDFMVRQAEAFAARVAKENPADAGAYALQLAFARPAREPERARLKAFLEAQTERYVQLRAGSPEEAWRRALVDLCQMLLCANEFAYIE